MTADQLGFNVTILLKPEEAAAELRLSRSKVYELLATGRLDSVVIGRSRRVTRGALDDYVRSLVAERREPEPSGGCFGSDRSADDEGEDVPAGLLP